MSVKAPIGLENIGNTCFANSVLQCLLQTPEMMTLLEKVQKKPWALGNVIGSKTPSPDRTSGRTIRQRRAASFKIPSESPEYWCTFCGIKALAQDMQSCRDEAVLPLGLKDIITKVFGEGITFGWQQDAHEFLIMLLHSLENSTCLKDGDEEESKDDYSFDFKLSDDSQQLNDVFEGCFTSKISCNNCKYNTKIDQKFMDINMDIKNTFDESMRDIFTPEVLEGDNQYDWFQWGKYTNATKTITLKEAPANLIINLKKFDKFGAKIKSGVEYPNMFDFNDYIDKASSKKKRGSSRLIYELYAVVNHEGNFSHFGHYNSYVKGGKGNWYLCDDSKIKRINGKTQTCSNKAYILFYRLVEGSRKKKSITRRISNVSTEEDTLSDTKTEESVKPKINRKRTRWSKSSNVSPSLEETGRKGIKRRNRKSAMKVIAAWQMSEDSDCTSCKSKKFKSEEE